MFLGERVNRPDYWEAMHPEREAHSLSCWKDVCLEALVMCPDICRRRKKKKRVWGDVARQSRTCQSTNATQWMLLYFITPVLNFLNSYFSYHNLGIFLFKEKCDTFVAMLVHYYFLQSRRKYIMSSRCEEEKQERPASLKNNKSYEHGDQSEVQR